MVRQQALRRRLLLLFLSLRMLRRQWPAQRSPQTDSLLRRRQSPAASATAKPSLPGGELPLPQQDYRSPHAYHQRFSLQSSMLIRRCCFQLYQCLCLWVHTWSQVETGLTNVFSVSHDACCRADAGDGAIVDLNDKQHRPRPRPRQPPQAGTPSRLSVLHTQSSARQDHGRGDLADAASTAYLHTVSLTADCRLVRLQRRCSKLGRESTLVVRRLMIGLNWAVGNGTYAAIWALMWPRGVSAQPPSYG